MIKQTALSLLVALNMSAHAWTSLNPSLRTARTSLAAAPMVDFSKYEGLGNDFILIDDRDKESPSLTPEASEKLCHRNFGVGADGVIFALKPPSDDFDFKMRIYNSDGSEPEMCGNGIRCFAQFLKDLGADGTCLCVENKRRDLSLFHRFLLEDANKTDTDYAQFFSHNMLVVLSQLSPIKFTHWLDVSFP